MRKLGVVLFRFKFRHANRISRVWPLYRKTPKMKNNTSYTTESNNNSSSSSQNHISRAEGIVLCSILLLEAIGIIAGNLLTIFQFALNKKLRKKSFFLVINMAIADVLLGAVSLPLLVILLVGPAYQLWQIEVNTSLLIFFNLLDAIFALASLISAVFISCERFFAIYKPLKHRTLSKKAYRIVLFTAWTLAICLAVVLTPLWYLVSSKHAFAIWMAFPLVFLFVVCGCNIGIYRQYQHRKIAASQQQNRDHQNQRLTRTLLFVSAIAVLSWLPLIIANFLIYVLKVSITRNLLFLLTINIINYLNSLVNPIVYAWRIPEFRKVQSLCCVGQVTTSREVNKGIADNVAIISPRSPQIRTLATDHTQQEFEQDVMDTKL